MIRRRIALLFLPTALILLIAGVAAWLMRTEPGARWLWQRVAAATDGALSAQVISGNLQSGLSIKGLVWRDASVSVTADTVRFSLDLGVWPLAVTVHRLEYGEIEIHALKGEAPKEAAAPDLAGLALPVPVALDGVRGGAVRGYAGTREPVVVIDRLGFSAYWFRYLRLSELVVEAPAMHWEGALELGFQAPFPLRFDLGGRLDSELTGLGQSLPVSVRLDGSLLAADLRAELDGQAALLEGKLRDLLTTPAWDLQLTAERLQWPWKSPDPGIVLEEAFVSSYGSLEDYDAELEGRLAGPGWPESRIRLVGSGDARGFIAEHLETSGTALEARGQGRFDWQPGLRAQARLDISQVDPGAWWSQWGAAAAATGRAALDWSPGRIDVQDIELSAPGSVERLVGSAAIDLERGTVSADLGWAGLVWPPGVGQPVVASPQGHARLGGRLDAWTVDGEAELSGPDFPDGRLQVRGGGDSESLHFEVPSAKALGGVLGGTVDFRWAPTVTWAADVRVEDVATAPLAPEFPGRVSGDLRFAGRSEPPQLDIEIRSLSGQIRGRQVAASGQVVVAGDRTRARELKIRSGGSELFLDGDMADAGGLAFQADFASLADWVDGAQGRLNGAGRIALVPGQPELELQLEGNDLEFGDFEIRHLAVAPKAGEEAGLRAELQDVAVGGSRFDSVEVEFAGEGSLQRIDALAAFGSGQVRAVLSGDLVDWRNPLAGGWQGRLEDFRWDGQTVGFLQLEAPAALVARPGFFRLDAACFVGPLDGRLCVDTSQLGGELELDAELKDISPNLVFSLLGTDLLLSQRLTGAITWRQQPGARPVARVNLGVSAGEVTLAGEQEALLATQAGLLGFEIANGQLYGGNLDIPVIGAGGIDTDFSAPDLSAGLESAVQGRVKIDLATIEPILRLLPGIEGSSGPLTADLQFSGSLSDPRLTGHASVVRGRIFHFASGLLLEDIRLAGAVYQFDQTQLSGSFRAGDGEGRIQALLDFDDLLDPELSVELVGENLTLIDVPDLRLIANPDIRLKWTPSATTIDGRVAVPSARLSPRYAPNSSAAESVDVVVVRGEDPYATDETEQPVESKLSGSLEIALGTDVFILLDRARAQLGGAVRLRWREELIPVASGGFTLSGEINAYGQSLNVTEGRINFSDRPVDNPFLNIRAEREIYGSSQIKRAGVLVTGTVKRPVLETYSVPMTTRERALAVLVTGSDFDYDQGVGSVEVGMYVAPKLYISYGIGLFDDQNVISARYDLGKGFGIKTTSGQRETGADISYTIDR